MSEKTLRICHLYPDLLNLYGDRGNILCMRRRLEWRGIDAEVTEVTVGEQADFTQFDLFFIGGGQDWTRISPRTKTVLCRHRQRGSSQIRRLSCYEDGKSNGADKPQAVILTGAQGDETHEARLRGYRSAVEQAGGTVLEVQYCDAQPDRAAAAMEAVMQKYPQGVDALLVTSDDMALAAIKCIWDNNSAAYQETVICGFDGNQAAVEALDRGELTVDIAQQGYEMGYKAVEAALDALEGKSVESVIDSGSEVITADNIDAYIADCREKGLWS